MIRHLFLAFAILIPSANVTAQEAVVFEGRPVKVVESTFLATREGDLTDDDAFEYQVRVVQRNGRFYWATRGMKELVRSESGAYMTYHAIDGTGYVRIGADFFLAMLDQLPEEQRRQEIHYMEHVLLQFGSITYYGRRR